MNDLVTFWKRNSLKVKLQVIHSFILLPGFVFHELCHWLMSKVLFVKVKKVVLEFYKLDGNNLKPFKGEIHTAYDTTTKLGIIKDLLINIAPLIGAGILVLIKWWLVFYVVIAWGVIKLSPTDNLNVQMNIKLLRK